MSRISGLAAVRLLLLLGTAAPLWAADATTGATPAAAPPRGVGAPQMVNLAHMRMLQLQVESLERQTAHLEWHVAALHGALPQPLLDEAPAPAQEAKAGEKAPGVAVLAARVKWLQQQVPRLAANAKRLETMIPENVRPEIEVPADPAILAYEISLPGEYIWSEDGRAKTDIVLEPDHAVRKAHADALPFTRWRLANGVLVLEGETANVALAPGAEPGVLQGIVAGRRVALVSAMPARERDAAQAGMGTLKPEELGDLTARINNLRRRMEHIEGRVETIAAALPRQRRPIDTGTGSSGSSGGKDTKTGASEKK